MNYIKYIFNKYFYYLLIFIINFYQKIISPIVPARCRYYPTCSNYGKQALQWHGIYIGSWLLLKRIGRCHPFGGSGIDFVPLPLARYHYSYYPKSDLKVDPDVVCQIPKMGWCVYRDKCSYIARLNHLLK